MPKNVLRWYPATFLLLNSLTLTIAGLAGLQANAEFQSVARMALVGASFLLAALMLAGGVWFARQESHSRQVCTKISTWRYLNALNLGIGALFGLFWMLAWLPAEKSGSLYYYFIGIQPFLGWAAFASGLSLLLGLSLHPNFDLQRGRDYWREQKTTTRAALIILLIMALLAALITWLKIGLSDEPYWYGAGVPMLAWQVYLILFAAALLCQVNLRWPKHSDLLIFFAIWGISAWFWAAQPLQASFFFPPPHFPNHEFYPFADPEFFDRASQYALIGQGINNGLFFDRTLYIAFLVYLHTWFGQDYELLMSIQAGVFAVLPAVIYLIAKNLHSRQAGLLAAALASWRGVNALAAMSIINTSTAKDMLTDFPTGLGLAIFALFAIQWVRDPHKNWHKAAWAAGALGLTSLLRPHVMLLLGIFLLIVFISALPRWRRAIAVSGLAFMAFFISIAPWAFLSGGDVSLMELYATRIRSVILQRYQPPAPQQIPSLPGQPGLLSVLIEEKMPFDVPFPISQFLNNLQTSAVILPLTPQLVSLREAVSAENVWRTHWEGELSLQAGLMFWLGLGLVALGIGAAAQKSLQVSLVLPAIYLLYAAANALARTSGGRYIVPIDWIVLLFFGLGLAILFEAGQSFFKRQQGAGESDRPAARAGNLTHWGVKALSVLACFGLIGGLIPFSQSLHPRRYQPTSQAELVERLVELGQPREGLEVFLQNEQAVILEGLALYPRFLGQSQGLTGWPPYTPEEFPRTVFMLLSQENEPDTVVLFHSKPEQLPHFSDALVLGCKQDKDGYYEGILFALVVALPGEGLMYAASPERPLECPVADPVCNNNKICH